MIEIERRKKCENTCSNGRTRNSTKYTEILQELVQQQELKCI